MVRKAFCLDVDFSNWREVQEMRHGLILCLVVVLLSGAAISSKAYGLEPGDIVFADSDGIWTGLGYNHAKHRFGLGSGHAGIYIGKKDGVDTVIEVVPYDGVVEISIDKFPGNGGYLGAKTTYPAPTPEQREKIVAYVKKQLGKEYTYVPWKKKGPEAFNCSGLVEAAYENVGLDPTPWWCGDMWFRWVWPIEQFYSPNVQSVDEVSGALSRVEAVLPQVWGSFEGGFLLLYFGILIILARRRSAFASGFQKRWVNLWRTN